MVDSVLARGRWWQRAFRLEGTDVKERLGQRALMTESVQARESSG